MSEITVLMSVYNGMPYLPEAVDSILAQTVQDFTFLIVNDGSKDETVDYLNRLTDKRIQVMHQSHRGQGAARTSGLARLNSKFVAIMDADDVALPTRLEAQLHFLHRHKEIGLVGTQVAYIGDSGRRGFSPPLPCDHESIYTDLLHGRHALVNGTIMCYVSILKRVGGYRIDSSGEDWDMFLRVGEASKLANLNEVLYLYRLHFFSVNIRHLDKIRTDIAYACHCAKHRAAGHPEISVKEFLIEQSARPFWHRLAEAMDVYALGQYRRALVDILNSNCLKGYAQLAYAVLCSPRWSIQRISRAIRKFRKS